MLRRIRVRGFKSIDDLEVELAPLVVVLGPNAAGKSNFLEAVLLLSRIVTERTLADAFDAPIRGYPAEAFTLPSTGLPGLLAQPEARLRLEATLDPPSEDSRGNPHMLRYCVEVRIDPRSGSLSVADEYLARLKKDETPLKAPRIERDGESLLVRRVNEPGHPRHEQVGLNHTLASNLQFTGALYPDFDRLRHELSAWRTYYLDPRVAMREPQPPRQVADVGPLGEWLAPFLFRLKQDPTLRPSFDAIRRVVRLAIPSVDDVDVDLDPQRGTLDVRVVQDGIPYSSRVISEGTLRVLALCAIAASPWQAGLMAFEEPENGVHPQRIEVVTKLLWQISERRRQQVVVTTHSPLLVAALARYQREDAGASDRIALLVCGRDGTYTRLRAFDSLGPLFDDAEIRDALSSPTEDAMVEQMLRRGLFDG